MVDINHPPETQDLIARFEPARAVCRPIKCDRGARCWVRNGLVDSAGERPKFYCVGCRDKPLNADLFPRHQETVWRLIISEAAHD